MNEYDKDQDNHQDVGCLIVTVIMLLGLLIAVLFASVSAVNAAPAVPLDPGPEDLSGLSDMLGTLCVVALILAAGAVWASDRMRRK